MRAWTRKQEALEQDWDGIVSDLEDKGLLDWPGIMIIDSVELLDSDEEGIRISMYTASYGGDSETRTISWVDLDRSKHAFRADKLLSEMEGATCYKKGERLHDACGRILTNLRSGSRRRRYRSLRASLRNARRKMCRKLGFPKGEGR